MINNIPSYLLALSLFLYPYGALNHSLYIIPQIIFIIIVLAKKQYFHSQEKGGARLFFIIYLYALSLLTSLAVESLSNSPNYLMIQKIMINGGTIVAICWSSIKLDLGIIKNGSIITAATTSIVALLAHQSAGTSWTEIALMFNSDEKLSSSQLYGFASPLEIIFITKNIVAMYLISLLSIYIFSLKVESKRANFSVLVVFFMSIVPFFSRQAIVAFTAILGLYFLSISSRTLKYLIIGAVLASSIFLFSVLFDLSSESDGAGERLILWNYFFSHVKSFWLEGYSLNGLNEILYANIGIDNFHMFFMNQIGAYGTLHFIAFTAFCLATLGDKKALKFTIILAFGYYINVFFQTYGYEFGNLILLTISGSYLHQRNKPASSKPISFNPSADRAIP